MSVDEAGARSVVVKVGGSLLDWPELPARLGSWLDGQRSVGPEGTTPAFLLIVGGGPFAHAVRDIDRIYGLGDERAHRLAIRSMDLTAAVLAGLLPGSRLIESACDLAAAWSPGLVAVLSPGAFLRELDDDGPDPLPASWEVTSDSIAARIADRLGVPRLVLLKSRAITPGASRRDAAALGLVDPRFPDVSAGVPLVEVVSLRDPEAGPCVLGP